MSMPSPALPSCAATTLPVKLSVTSRGAGCPTTPSSPRVAMTTLETAYSTPNRAAVQPAQRGARGFDRMTGMLRPRGWAAGPVGATRTATWVGPRRDLRRTSPRAPRPTLVIVLPRVHTWLDRHPAAGDAGVAVVLLLFCLSTFVGGERDAGVVDVVFTVLLCAPLAVRRRAPVATFAAVMVLCGAELLLVDSFLAANAAALIALYTLVVYAPRPLAAAGVCVALAGTVPFALHFDDLSESSETLAWVVLTVHLLLAALLGDRMRAERERRAAAAASEERARIARELHDVVAHSLSVVIAQADGGRYAAEHDPAAATDALRTIARSAREAQGEMRRALGVLGSEDAAPLQPQPGVGQIATLVERTREAGLAIRFDERGDARPVAPAAGMTVYRVAQEALTNVLKHAGPGAAASLELRWEPRAVTLVVRDDGDGAPGLGRRPRAWPRGHARARRAARRHAARRPPAGRRLRGGGDDPRVIRVFLVDDQALVRAGFRLVIDSQPDMTVVGEAGDGRDALEALGVTSADVVLMDVRMPELDGVAATAHLVERDGDAAPRVVMLTTFDLDEYVFSAIRAGASGFLLKDAEPEELLAAIRAVATGDAVVAPSATRRLLEQVADRLPGTTADPRLETLTEREHAVLLEVARGASNLEVGDALFMAEATVKTHVGRLLAKLGARDRVQLVVFAYESGLVRPGSDPGGTQG